MTASGSIALVVSPGRSAAGRDGSVARWVGGREVHEVAAACKLGGDDAGDRGLADATLAGHEDDTTARLLELDR